MLPITHKNHHSIQVPQWVRSLLCTTVAQVTWSKSRISTRFENVKDENDVVETIETRYGLRVQVKQFAWATYVSRVDRRFRWEHPLAEDSYAVAE